MLLSLLYVLSRVSDPPSAPTRPPAGPSSMVPTCKDLGHSPEQQEGLPNVEEHLCFLFNDTIGV